MAPPRSELRSGEGALRPKASTRGIAASSIGVIFGLARQCGLDIGRELTPLFGFAYLVAFLELGHHVLGKDLERFADVLVFSSGTTRGYTLRLTATFICTRTYHEHLLNMVASPCQATI